MVTFGLPVRKMRVEVYDELGDRYVIGFEGRVTREKALRILDIVELLGGMPGVDPELSYSQELSKTEKVLVLLKKHFPIVWFSAKDLKSIYEKEVGEPINLSTVSTYLSRIADRGMLVKTRNSNKVLFRLVSKEVKKFIKNSLTT
jgi:hypothetical protein